MTKHTKSLRRAFAPRTLFVRVTHRGFLLGDELVETLTGRIVGIQLLRKLFEDGQLSCDSPDGLRARDGTLCDECKHDLCRPQLRVRLADGFTHYVLDLSTTSAHNLFALEDQVATDGATLDKSTVRLTVMDRGQWGEILFERG